MKFPLFSQVRLVQYIPQFNLKKGSIGAIVGYYATPERQEDGYSLEDLIYQDTVEVAESQIAMITIEKNEKK